MPIMPINLSEVLVAFFCGLALLVPVVGLTARFALRPVVDAMARMKEAGNSRDALAMLERRMSLVEQEIQGIEGLRDEIARLADAHRFQLKLVAKSDTAAE